MSRTKWFVETSINDRLMNGSAVRIDLADGIYTVAGDQGQDLPPGGTVMTCTRTGLALDCAMALRDRHLSCRERIDPAAVFHFAMAITADGSRIIGEHPWTMAVNDQCQLTDLTEGGPALTYRYVLTRTGLPTADDEADPAFCDPFEDDNCPDPLGGLIDPGDNE